MLWGPNSKAMGPGGLLLQKAAPVDAEKAAHDADRSLHMHAAESCGTHNWQNGAGNVLQGK